MLPERLRGDSAVGKYADSAIPELLAQMERRGGQRRNIEAYLAGGRHDVQGQRGLPYQLDRGKKHRGGTPDPGEPGYPGQKRGHRRRAGRTVLFDNDTAQLQVRTLQKIPWKREAK